ncbi:unnamed protein product [Cylindrotheca closterium]|uniref:Uncharacterized protein n=1 Tax=Cylindrotheca closterium TaxID=2856 RepID=A0AAD2CPJ9_9STRA|nr:unnamed protein product [Cylindrotheca closterium]
MLAARDMDDGATVASAAKLAVQLEAMKADVSDLCGELETATSALKSTKAKSAAEEARIQELEAMMAHQQLVKGKLRGASPSSSKTNSADSGGGPITVVPNHQRSRQARLRRQTEGRIRNLRNQPSSQAAHSLLVAYLNSLSPGNFFGDD